MSEKLLWAEKITEFLSSAINIVVDPSTGEANIELAPDQVDIDELEEVIARLNPALIIIAATLMHSLSLWEAREKGETEKALMRTEVFLQSLREIESIIEWARNTINDL